MNNFKKFFTYLIVGALVTVLSVSCGKNPAEPDGGVSEDLTATIPTATGDPATDLANAYYRGTLSLTSHSVNATSGVTKEELENDILSQGDMTLYLNITNNNLKWAYYSSEVEGLNPEQVQQSINSSDAVQLLKSGSKYSVSVALDYSSNGGYIEKLYIEFTISGDNISITYIYGLSVDYVDEVDGVNYKYSYKTTYEGTLTKYTPAAASGS